MLHDNAGCHVAAMVSLFRGWNCEAFEHPPNSPDMSPGDYDLFSKIKEPLRGIRFQSRVDIQRALDRSVRVISRNGAADGVRRLRRIWQRILDLAGDYK